MNGRWATTLPSKIELNMERSDVKTKPMANIDFILTIIKSLKSKPGVTRNSWQAYGKGIQGDYLGESNLQLITKQKFRFRVRPM